MKRGLGGGVEQETVPVGAGLVAAVGGDDEQRGQGVLKLLAHFGDGLAVTSTTVVHRLPWEKKRIQVILKHEEGWRKVHTCLASLIWNNFWGDSVAPTHKFDLPHSMREQQAVWAERTHFGTHLTKYRLGSVRTCQAPFATGTLHLQGEEEEEEKRLWPDLFLFCA